MRLPSLLLSISVAHYLLLVSSSPLPVVYSSQSDVTTRSLFPRARIGEDAKKVQRLPPRIYQLANQGAPLNTYDRSLVENWYKSRMDAHNLALEEQAKTLPPNEQGKTLTKIKAARDRDINWYKKATRTKPPDSEHDKPPRGRSSQPSSVEQSRSNSMDSTSTHHSQSSIVDSGHTKDSRQLEIEAQAALKQNPKRSK